MKEENRWWLLCVMKEKQLKKSRKIDILILFILYLVVH